MNNSLISPAQYLDYEDTSVFMLVIGVGNGEMVFDNATVTVHVNDTNDNPPLLSPLHHCHNNGEQFRMVLLC